MKRKQNLVSVLNQAKWLEFCLRSPRQSVAADKGSGLLSFWMVEYLRLLGLEPRTIHRETTPYHLRIL